MSDRVLVFSADELRGKIIKKVLNRNGFDCLLFNRILEAGGAIAQHAPPIVVFDTESCFSEEINRLRNISHRLKRAVAIVLGEAVVIERFERRPFRKTLCLPDPFDPELIAVKVNEIIAQQQQKRRVGDDRLEKNLKSFLNIG